MIGGLFRADKIRKPKDLPVTSSDKTIAEREILTQRRNYYEVGLFLIIIVALNSFPCIYL